MKRWGGGGGGGGGGGWMFNNAIDMEEGYMQRTA